MWGRIVYKVISFLLKRERLSIEERNLYTGLILDKLEAIPLRDIISRSDAGEILINDVALDVDRARVLMDRANSALDNNALNLAWEQVRWLAFKEGLGSGLSPESLLFYRAALWFSDQTRIHLKVLAGREQSTVL